VRSIRLTYMAAAFRSRLSLLLPRAFDVALVAILAIVGFVAVLRIGLQPSDPVAGVAVIYAPWTPADETMHRAVGAGARFVRFGGFDFIAIVMPDGPGYVDRVLAGSALLAVDPQVLAACLPAASSPTEKAL
jgi:hypothetical protein